MRVTEAELLDCLEGVYKGNTISKRVSTLLFNMALEIMESRKLSLIPDVCHESHKRVRGSDASTFDFICDDCGATDKVPGNWGTLRFKCSK